MTMFRYLSPIPVIEEEGISYSIKLRTRYQSQEDHSKYKFTYLGVMTLKSIQKQTDLGLPASPIIY